ncbi:MAG: ankyrin repeat domain-containing protein [Puniceicoccales bacterium]|jgi:hypothetical protein|nr:ankyrin repeat domain-containing protein [Puniceicoccales bacterium]
MKKNIKLITAALLLGTQTLIGSNLFVSRGASFFVPIGTAMDADQRMIVNAIQAGNIPGFNLYLGADALYGVDNVRFDRERTLAMAIMEAARRGFISRENAYYFIMASARAYPDMVNGKDLNGKSLLDYAIEGGGIDLIEFILEIEGLNFSVHDNNIKRFMDLIIHFRKLEWIRKANEYGMPGRQMRKLLEYVLARKAYLESWRNFFSHTFEFLFPRSVTRPTEAEVCSELVTVLQGLGAEKARTKNERKLIKAIGEFSPEKICPLLATKDLNINYQDQRGYTPLMWAAAMGDLAIVLEILVRGPDLDMTNSDGETVFDIARKNRNEDIIDALDQARQGQMTR